MFNQIASSLIARQSEENIFDTLPDDEINDPSQQELYSSWTLLILILLLIGSLWTSYYLQARKIQAVHETVVAIFAGMIIGLIIRTLPGHYIQDSVSFSYTYFFNMLLPPIILNCGYELNQANFFRNIGTVLTFAFLGTFISAVVLGCIIYVWAFLGLEGLQIPFVAALGFGATLSATDPVTILSIFNTYKVDPKLYTIIFGESILNDAVCIVMFETTQRFHGESATVSDLFKGIGIFLVTFTVSLFIGATIGVMTALILKHSQVRTFPQIETCLILLFAYASYFFSNGCHMSGIVSLLFCGITLKHYAYFNMSRQTQIATRIIFATLAQLSEIFIFIYLGLSLFTDVELVYKPLLIIVTAFGICVSRWAAVFPLSRLLNHVFKINARRIGRPIPAAIPLKYQVMLFWAGLRGAVGVALAAGLEGESVNALRATVLVVVVLTVIVFGGTTARMLELLGIQTGVESDDISDDIDLESNLAKQLAVANSQAAVSLTRSPSDKAHRSPEASPITQFSTATLQVPDRLSSDSRGSRSDGISSRGTTPPPLFSRTTSSEHSQINSGISPSGIISGLLARSAEDHAKWFQKFDDTVRLVFLLTG
ncbi:Sodium/hydrogen exchanger family-domain-containing protein [Lipomyces oligophaga]|uniref:Sodium/hydrogen exchanger family-domain-containing protein n=1 Tax=Lipomyces oligophaga TaxID=45792 RepID=UPI0034CE36FB